MPFSRAIRTGLAGLFVAVELTGCAAPNLTPPVHGTFTPTGSTASARPSHTATLLPDGRVLMIGVAQTFPGRTPSAELYDPETGTFGPTGSMAHAREIHTATSLSDGRVLVAGGFGESLALASSELYDPGSGTFSETGSMTSVRDWHTAALLSDGRVLIVGGQDGRGLRPVKGSSVGSGSILASAELYQP